MVVVAVAVVAVVAVIAVAVAAAAAACAFCRLESSSHIISPPNNIDTNHMNNNGND